MAKSDEVARFQELLRELLAGSQEAAGELAETYGGHVRRCVRYRLPSKLRSQFDSLDFVQIVWKSVFTEPDMLAKLEDPEQFVRFLAGVARNKVISAGRRLALLKSDVRREVPLNELSPDVGSHPASRDPTPSTVASFREQWEELVEEQPPLEKLIIGLRYEGGTYREIANRLAMDESTVRKIVRELKVREQQRQVLRERLRSQRETSQ